ncbi:MULTISPECIES: GNAT family N-acetyltransferase [Xanthomonas]|uniref:GNAT family N-acetyltransferase n=1 Tax=Xanthomonas TaxID=338 RepID=UPI001AD9F0E5|nr:MULTISPECIES: GNAT family N-acetyltransferase [unclassified Xanthomonas]MBO9872761.1 GNAT family N-acetyltransferase [Xanthomonas sp. D-93]WNH45015.1 GNAT family N-acetyltransferase [Xanthomonas sp. A6251]
MSIAASPGFPQRDAGLAAPPALRARGIVLRPAQAEDLDWLRALYASTRRDELAAVPWPEPAKRAFLDQQFALQHAHYLQHFAGADFLIVEDARARLGRLYLDRSADPHVLVDISLLPDCRGQGIGGALIAQAQALADADGRALTLHVLHANPAAQRLYARLGFVAGAAGQTHLAMRWDGPGTKPDTRVS